MRDPAPAPVFDLEAFLAGERSRAEEALGRALGEVGRRFPPRLAAPVVHAATAPGKRLRPILCAAAYRASGGQAPEVHDVAAALELIHTYSLMHDDLPCMDDAELRRGRPAAHRIFGEEAVMVAAAALIPFAAVWAWRWARRLEGGEGGARRVVVELARGAGAGGMVGGQVLDLEGEGSRPTPEGLDDLHGRKTGALLTAGLRIGGVAAAAPEETIRALDRYGRRLGLAFQIVDDVLDATARPGVVGKTTGRDEALGKATYVGLYGVEGARRRAREAAVEAVAALEASGIGAPALAALARFVVERDH